MEADQAEVTEASASKEPCGRAAFASTSSRPVLRMCSTDCGRPRHGPSEVSPVAGRGSPAAKPYDDLESVHARITSAAGMLMRMARAGPLSPNATAQFEKFHHVIWEEYPPDQPDEVREKIDKLITDVEQSFRSEITEAGRSQRHLS